MDKNLGLLPFRTRSTIESKGETKFGYLYAITSSAQWLPIAGWSLLVAFERNVDQAVD